jgi:hypothetical protein
MHARIHCNCNHNLAFHQSLCQGAGHKQDMALPVLSMSYHTRFTCCFFLPFLQQFNSFNLEYSAHPLYEVRTQYNNCKLNLQIENQQFTCVVIDAINKARKSFAKKIKLEIFPCLWGQITRLCEGCAVKRSVIIQSLSSFALFTR